MCDAAHYKCMPNESASLLAISLRRAIRSRQRTGSVLVAVQDSFDRRKPGPIFRDVGTNPLSGVSIDLFGFGSAALSQKRLHQDWCG